MEETPNEIKYSPIKKFEDKVLVWIAISPCGQSAPYICQSGLAINQNIYWNECIRKRLIPFIRENYDGTPYVFFPDRANCHYAKSVLDN